MVFKIKNPQEAAMKAQRKEFAREIEGLRAQGYSEEAVAQYYQEKVTSDPRFKDIPPEKLEQFRRDIEDEARRRRDRERSLLGRLRSARADFVAGVKTGAQLGAVMITLFGGAIVGYEAWQYLKPQLTQAYEQAYKTPEQRLTEQRLREDLGENSLRELEDAEGVTDDKDRQAKLEADRHLITAQGFEGFTLTTEKGEIIKIDNETISQIVGMTFPRGFVYNIQTVRYIDKQQMMPKEYGPKFSHSTKSADADVPGQAVEVFNNNHRRKPYELMNTLTHEVAHFNDPFTSKLLTQDERDELLLRLMQRLEASDHYKSDYVESISSNDTSPQAQQLVLREKIIEYWAEISAAYLTSDYYALPQADKALVEHYISSIDPHFDRARALEQRYFLFHLIYTDKNTQKAFVKENHGTIGKELQELE